MGVLFDHSGVWHVFHGCSNHLDELVDLDFLFGRNSVCDLVDLGFTHVKLKHLRVVVVENVFLGGLEGQTESVGSLVVLHASRSNQA